MRSGLGKRTCKRGSFAKATAVAHGVVDIGHIVCVRHRCRKSCKYTCDQLACRVQTPAFVRSQNMSKYESYSVLLCDRAKSLTAEGEPTGAMAPTGFEVAHLRRVCKCLCEEGLDASIVDLTPHCRVEGAQEACILVIRGWRPDIADAALKQVQGIEYDTFTHQYGRVVQAHSRHVVFVGEKPRKADKSIGMRTVLGWQDVGVIEKARAWIAKVLDSEEYLRSACILKYPDIRKCGISAHGDGERRRTIVYRVGEVSSKRSLNYQWYHEGEEASDKVKIDLHHGDFAVSSEVAVGTNWKKRKIPTLRHSTGFIGKEPAVRKKQKVATS